MPTGGARVGTGRKPRVVVSARPVVPGDVPAAPESLTPRQQELWRELAPLAVQRQTLHKGTVPGFVELCQQLEMKEQIWQAVQDAGGAAVAEAEGLLRQYIRLAQRLDQSLGRFRLTGGGKPDEDAVKAAPAENPWARVAS